MTGKLVAEATGLPRCAACTPATAAGAEQISAMIACGEVDMLLFFRDPVGARADEPNAVTLLRLCDTHTIPVATNIATAEVLIHGLERGGPRLDRSPARPQINKPNKQTKHALPLFCGRAYLAYAGDHSAPAGRMRPMPWMRSIKKPDTVTVTSDQAMRCTGR